MIYLGRAGLAAREPGRAWQMLMLRSVLRPSLRELGLGLDSGDPQLSLDKIGSLSNSILEVQSLPNDQL